MQQNLRAISEVRRRLQTHKATVKKLLQRGAGDVESQTEFVQAVLWRILGFPESSIIDMPNSVIGIELFEEVQFAVEICPFNFELGENLSQNASRYAYEHKLRYYVQTNGFLWRMFEADGDSPRRYKSCSFIDWSDSEDESSDFLPELSKFACESHQREIVTDATNRKRWYGHWSEVKGVAAYLFLIEFARYADSSERVHVPLLGVTFWSDKPFEARNKAWAGIDEYISKNLRTLSYGTFETIAYKGEASPFREGVSFEREAVAHRFDASDQG